MNNLIAFILLISISWSYGQGNSTGKTCKYNLNVAFVVEDTNWCPDVTCEGQVKFFLVQIADRFVVNPDDSRIAMQTYNDNSNPIFYFNDNRDIAAVEAAIGYESFQHKNSYAPIGDALTYTLNQILSVQHGETSSVPDVIILLSYSSANDPDEDKARAVAKQLRSYGIEIVVIRVGPKHDDDFLNSFANQVFTVDRFDQLDHTLVDKVMNVSCDYWPDRLYPCEIDRTVAADLVFLVDTSSSLNNGDITGITGFIDNFLKPYKKANSYVRAALVTYDIKPFVAINLTNSAFYDRFIDQAKMVLNKPKDYPIRNIAAGLTKTYTDILARSIIERPNTNRLVMVFAAGSFFGPDPTEIAYQIRLLQNTSIYVTTLDPAPQFANYKELIDVAGDTQRIFPISVSPETTLPKILPEIAWQLLCPKPNPLVSTPTPKTTQTNTPTLTGTRPTTTNPPTNLTTTAIVTDTTRRPSTTHYIPTSTTYVPRTTTPFVPDRCAADVVFLIDESSSITPYNFEHYVKPFMANLAKGLHISFAHTHLAVIQFSDVMTTSVELYLNTSYDPQVISDRILHLPFNGGNAALHTALNLAYTRVFTKQGGARLDDWVRSVAAYVFIITDGIATDVDNGMAYTMLQSDIAIYAVGVGPLATREYLEKLTYDPKRIYNINNFNELTRDLEALILNDTFCPLNFTTPTPSPPPTYCDQIDLVFVLDESMSVNQENPQNFDVVKSFLIYLLEIFTINQRNTRVAVVGYGRYAETSVSFTDNVNLVRKIENLRYHGGARNVAAGLENAYNEINSYGRRSPNVGTYLVHIADYAHDVDQNPVSWAKALGQNFGVKIFNVALESFQWDSIFATEAADITNAGAKGSMQFNVFNYTSLFESNIKQTFKNILDKDYRCTTPSSVI